MVDQWDRGEREERLDAVFSALSHRSRRGVLRELARVEAPQSMEGLAELTQMSPQLLGKHVDRLERAGLVSRSRSGRKKRIQVHAEPLDSAQAWIEETSAFWHGQLDALGDYIESIGDGRDCRGAGEG